MQDRYHRQKLLPFIGEAGQSKLSAAKVLLIGCGALGSNVAEQLVRAGVGHLIIVDRDVVEWTNLQRQVLFDENDARDGVPKAIAAARRLASVNSQISITPHVVDVHAGNIETFLHPSATADPHKSDAKRYPTPFISELGANADGQESNAKRYLTPFYSGLVDLIVDGTDNVETRYLINDLAVKHGIPWIYGACVGTDGRVMTIRPGVSACLCCVFPDPPAGGELPTCDTAGVLGPAIAVVAGYQAAAAIKIVSGNIDATDTGLLTIDFWKNRHHTIDTGGRRAGCTCCDRRDFPFLDRPIESSLASLCGRNAVQVRPAHPVKLDLQRVADRLAGSGAIESSPFLLRVRLNESPNIVLTLFGDGRCIVQGTSYPARARSLVSQYVGS